MVLLSTFSLIVGGLVGTLVGDTIGVVMGYVVHTLSVCSTVLKRNIIIAHEW